MDVEQRARELFAAEIERDGFTHAAEWMRDPTKPLRHIEAEALRAIIAALTPPEGHVVVTRNDAGQAVAVTRQDDGGRILSVIAEFEATKGDMGNPISVPDGYALVPVDVRKDAERYRWLRDSAPEEWDVTRWLDNDTQELHVQDYLDEAIDSAMLAARPEEI